MADPYAPISPGIEGTVDFVDDIGTLHCNFDNGRSIGVIVGEDSFTVIDLAEEQGMNQENPSINMGMEMK